MGNNNTVYPSFQILVCSEDRTQKLFKWQPRSRSPPPSLSGACVPVSEGVLERARSMHPPLTQAPLPRPPASAFAKRTAVAKTPRVSRTKTPKASCSTSSSVPPKGRRMTALQRYFMSGTKLSSPRSPAKLTRSPRKLRMSPHKLRSSPHKLRLSPHKLRSSPHKLIWAGRRGRAGVKRGSGVPLTPSESGVAAPLREE